MLIDLANYEASMATLREKLPSWSDTSLSAATTGLEPKDRPPASCAPRLPLTRAIAGSAQAVREPRWWRLAHGAALATLSHTPPAPPTLQDIPRCVPAVSPLISP